jgi:hypothetical protein
MTTDATGGYQPPGSEWPLESVSGPDSSGSTTETAQYEATQVGQTAKEKSTEVASTAADEAKNVASEAKTQARNLLHETQTQVREQAGVQKDKAASGLHSIGDQLRSMADGAAGGQQSGMVTDLARQASHKAHEVAGWLESREPGTLVEDIRGLARRKPGTFLLGAAVAGVLAGRMTRGAVDNKRAENDSATGYNGAPTQEPTYAGAATPGGAAGDDGPTQRVRTGGATVEEILVVEDPVAAETDPLTGRQQRAAVGGDLS